MSRLWRPWDGWPNEPFELDAEHPAADGMEFWWPGQPSWGGNTLRDLRGGAHLALQTGATLVQDGERGPVLDLDGSTGYATIASQAVSFTDTLTVAFWVKFDTLVSSNFYCLLSYGGYVSGGFMLNRLDLASYGNRLAFAWGGTDFYLGAVLNTTAEWIFNAVTVKGGTPQHHYVGRAGVLTRTAFTRNTGSGTYSATSPKAITIGRREDSASQYTDGKLDWLTVSNRDLSEGQIAYLYDPATRWDLALPFQRPAYRVPTTGTAWTKDLSETLGLTESRIFAVGKSLAESFTLLDTRTLAAARHLSETITLSEAVARSCGKSLSETVSLSDALSRAAAKTLAETLGLTDTRSLAAAVALAESLALSDGRTLGSGKGLTEGLSFTDGRSLAPGKHLAETVSLSDTVSALLVIVLTLAETLSLSDARTLGAGKGLAELLALSEARSLAASKVLAETLPLADLVAALLDGPGAALVLHLVETLSLADQATLRMLLLRYVATLERVPKPVAELLASLKPLAYLTATAKPVAEFGDS